MNYTSIEREKEKKKGKKNSPIKKRATINGVNMGGD